MKFGLTFLKLQVEKKSFWLTQMCQVALNSEKVPKDQQTEIVILVYKKIDRKE